MLLLQDGGSNLQPVATVVAAVGGALLGSFGSYIVERDRERRKTNERRKRLRSIFAADIVSQISKMLEQDGQEIESRIFNTYIDDLLILSHEEVTWITLYYNDPSEDRLRGVFETLIEKLPREEREMFIVEEDAWEELSS